MRRVILAILVALSGCAAERVSLPSGTYNVVWPEIVPGAPHGTMVVSSEAIDLSTFHPEMAIWSSYFDLNETRTVCFITTAELDAEGQRTSVAFSDPKRTDSFWTVPIYENHHFKAWMTIQDNGGILTAEYQSIGMRGPQKISLGIRRIGKPNIDLCHDVEENVIPPEYY